VQFKIQFSQGSAATDLRWSGRFNITFLCSSSENMAVKNLLKLVHICCNYEPVFLRQCNECIYASVCGSVSSAVFVKPDGSLYREGDVMYRPQLADTLDKIASDNGVWDLYNGSLARSMIQDLHDIG